MLSVSDQPQMLQNVYIKIKDISGLWRFQYTLIYFFKCISV